MARHPRDARALPRARSTTGSPSARSTRASRAPWQRAREQLRPSGPLLPERGRAVAAHDRRSGDDKDRVLERSSGEPTYFAADVAYHWDKLDRGYDRLINVLGADHHGYVARLKAAVAARRRRSRPARDPDPPVRPRRRGRRARVDVQAARRVRHARRADRGDRRRRHALVHALALGATRRSTSTSTLAREQSAENPVYYVQYAHARIASVLRQGGRGARGGGARRAARAGCALEPAERELIKKLLAFPAEVAEAADRRAPHRIAAYALETRAGVHRLLPRLPRRRRRARRRWSPSGSRSASRRSG